MSDPFRYQGESIVKWRNRCLLAKGITDREWCESSDVRLYLRDRVETYPKMDLGE